MGEVQTNREANYTYIHSIRVRENTPRRLDSLSNETIHNIKHAQVSDMKSRYNLFTKTLFRLRRVN